MMARPISRSCSSVVCIDSCQSRWSESEPVVESVFSIGGSSLTSDGRARPIPVVEVVAEEILVVGVVPAVGLFRRRLLGLGLFGLLLFSRLELLGRNLFEQRVLDHLLVQQV